MSDSYTPDDQLVAIANWRNIVAVDPTISERAFIVLLPILVRFGSDVREHGSISPDVVRSVLSFLDSAIAEDVAVSEFMDWAVANAPAALVSNMARVGLLV